MLASIGDVQFLGRQGAAAAAANDKAAVPDVSTGVDPDEIPF